MYTNATAHKFFESDASLSVEEWKAFDIDATEFQGQLAASAAWQRIRYNAFPIQSYINFFIQLTDLFKADVLKPEDYVYWYHQFQTLPDNIKILIRASEDIDDNPTGCYKMKKVNEYICSMADVLNTNNINTINQKPAKDVDDAVLDSKRMFMPQHTIAMNKISPDMQRYIMHTTAQCVENFRSLFHRINRSDADITTSHGYVMVCDETYIDQVQLSIPTIVKDLKEAIGDCMKFLEHARGYNPMDYKRCNTLRGTDTIGYKATSCGATLVDMWSGNHIQPERKGKKLSVDRKLNPEFRVARENECESAKIPKK